MTSKDTSLVPRERIVSAILAIRGEKVLLDVTLAALYGMQNWRFVSMRLKSGTTSSWARYSTPFAH
ncbi:MAG: hypothetical protein ACYC7A_21265 [Thermoanaerobaculia bacterium]